MTTLLENAAEELSRTKIALMTRKDSTFFTTLCFSMRFVFDESVRTMETDGRYIYISPEFFMGVRDPSEPVQFHDREERLFGLVHECMHPAYDHMGRMPAGGCHDRWNIACDHVINLQLKERGFKVPSWVHCDPQFTGMSTEEVYALLPDNPGLPSMQDLKAMSGSGKDGKATQAEIDAIRRDMQDILIQARIQSKMAGDKPGTVPGDIELMLDKLLNPVLPMKVILSRFMKSFDKTDYSWRKPNRRFFPKHHLPSLWGESLVDLAWAVDASGSVSDRDFQQFLSEIHPVFRMYKPKKMTLLDFDTKIHHVHDVTSVQQLEQVKFTGRGGTNVTPVFEWANKNKPQALLIFTDGGFHWPKIETKVPIVWLIHNNPKWNAPYGKVIHYQIKK
jgi:predicted metal-dependent peptidase